tara:strand:- start:33 stop:449 length:417 start_codon:yes stop_codon:yes gene_type:complete
MFNLLVSLLFFLVSSDLKAEWTKVADTGNLGKDNYILFVDFNSIKKEGDISSLWNLKNYKTSQEIAEKVYISNKEKSEYNCARETTRILSFSWFTHPKGRGSMVHTDSEPTDFRTIFPETIDDVLMKIACGKLLIENF